MSENQEMNLFDLLRLFFGWMGRCFVRLFHFCGKILQLTYRKIWLVAIVTIVGVVAGFYFSRPSNRMYEAGAMAMLNGFTPQTAKAVNKQVEMAFGSRINNGLSIANLLNLPDSIAKEICRFESFYVIDFLNDSTPDVVDFKNNHALDDTVNVISSNYLYFRFRVKDVNKMPQIETALLNYFNSDEALQLQFANYKTALYDRLCFMENQIQRIDSLEKITYFQPKGQPQLCIDRWNSSMLIGEQRTQLLHEDMQGLIVQKDKLKEQLITSTAPIVLTSHFAVNPKAVNNRLLCCSLGLFGGYVLGLLIALIAEQFKNIIAFLRKR